MSDSEMADARRRMQALFEEDEEEHGFEALEVDEVEEIDEADEVDIEESGGASRSAATGEDADREHRVLISEARALLERSRRLLDTMNVDDREEAISFHEQLEDALTTANWSRLRAVMTELADLLFYVEES